MMECPGCFGTGTIDIGDCEDGVVDDCPECDGDGVIEDTENNDVFVAERDAFTAND